MKDTCDFKTCKVAKRLKLKLEDECPNFLDSKWVPEGKPESEAQVVKDCCPKRTLLCIHDLYSRLIGVERSQEHQTNALLPLNKMLKAMKITENSKILPPGEPNETK